MAATTAIRHEDKDEGKGGRQGLETRHHLELQLRFNTLSKFFFYFNTNLYLIYLKRAVVTITGPNDARRVVWA